MRDDRWPDDGIAISRRLRSLGVAICASIFLAVGTIAFGQEINQQLPTPVPVSLGGTGVATLTSGNILTGNGTGAITSIAPGTGVATALANAVNVAGGFPTVSSPTFAGTVTGALTWSNAQTFSSAITYGGVTLSNAVTGTGNMVLSASPTLSGTVAGTLTFSGGLTLSSALTYGGVTLSNAVTGTGNMVLATTPTLTSPVTGAQTSASTVAASNFDVANASASGNAAAALLLFGGATGVNYRVGLNGTTSTTAAASNSIGNLIVGSVSDTEAASGTHAIVCNLCVLQETLTNGSATTTDAATVYIAGPGLGTATITNQKTGFWLDSGIARFDGDIMTGPQTAPTLASCGTGSPTINAKSSDTAGEITEGTTTAGCTINFTATKTNAPFCVVSSQTADTAFGFTITTAAIVIVNTSTSGHKFDYHCIQAGP